MFQARTRDAQAGFTLLELLVVLALTSLILTATPAIYSRVVPAYQLRQFGSELADYARGLREKARATGLATRLTFDPDTGTILFAGTSLTPPAGLGFSAAFTPDPINGSGAHDELMFFPDGGSNGGVVELRRNGLVVYVRIDWVSGAVKLDT